MPDGKPEIYLAVQGEGKTIGKPMIFLRCSMCNLHCNFCDTFYTWNFEDVPAIGKDHWANKVKRSDYVIEMNKTQVLEAIDKIGIKAINFTGGEPTIQQAANLEIMQYLRANQYNWHFETETNGTVKMKEEYISMLDQINCSPKLKSSGNLDAIRKRPEVIKQLRDSGKVIFKFVIKKETYTQDIIEVKEWQNEHEITNNVIYLMPEGIETQRIIEGTRFLMDRFANQGYNISTRLQVICYGTKRAV